MENIQPSTFNLQRPTGEPAIEPLKIGCSRWLLLNSGACPPAFNMALDEVLLETMPRLGKPVLRFYGWTEPAASFGYFQKFAAVERATALRPLIRRSTGGGLVPHDADWTYSLAFPAGHEWYLLRAEESYRRAHEWIQSAFANLNVRTEIASGCEKSTSGQCFRGHEKFDLLWRGRKIAGAAQRRTQAGLLIQGSVQSPPPGLRRADWESAMNGVMNGSWESFQPDEAMRERSERLVAQKYSQADFLKKR